MPLNNANLLAGIDPTDQTLYEDSIDLFQAWAQFTNRGLRGPILFGDLDDTGTWKLHALYRLPATASIQSVDGGGLYTDAIQASANAVFAPVVDHAFAVMTLFRPRTVWASEDNSRVLMVSTANPHIIMLYNLLTLTDNVNFQPYAKITLTSGYEIHCIVESPSFIYTVEKQSANYYVCQRDKTNGTLLNSYDLGATAGGFSLHYFKGNVYLVYHADWDALCTAGATATEAMLFARFSADLRLYGAETFIYESSAANDTALGWWDTIKEEDKWLETDTPTQMSQETSRQWWTCPIFCDDEIFLPAGLRIYRYTPELIKITQTGSGQWVNTDYWLLPSMSEAGTHVGEMVCIGGGWNKVLNTLHLTCKVDTPSVSGTNRIVASSMVPRELPDNADSTIVKAFIDKVTGDSNVFDAIWAITVGRVVIR